MSGIIKGRDSNDQAISCANSSIEVKITPNKKVCICDLYFHSCDDILLQSRSKCLALNISNTKFTNSCLRFEQRLTRSSYHNTRVAIRNATFENCPYSKVGSLLHFSTVTDVLVELYKVNVTNCSVPFLKSKNIVASIDGCFFFGNKNFLLYIEDSKLLFKGAAVNFIENRVKDLLGAPVYAKSSIIEFKDSIVIINRNQGFFCGGIVAESSQILFNNNVTVTFSNNEGRNGGALSLYGESSLMFNATESYIALKFMNNTAQTGGAIYVTFSNNKGRNGRALSLYGGSSLMFLRL